MGVVGRGERVDGLGGGEGLLAEGFGFAALCGVEDEDAVGEGGDAGGALCWLIADLAFEHYIFILPNLYFRTEEMTLGGNEGKASFRSASSTGSGATRVEQSACVPKAVFDRETVPPPG